MARRLRSPRRSRVENTVVSGPEASTAPAPTPSSRAVPVPPARRARIRPAPPAAPEPARPGTASAVPPASDPPVQPGGPAAGPALIPAETGWNWFATWQFPTVFFLASFALAAGVFYWRWFQAEPAPPAPRAVPAAKTPAQRPRLITSESFGWLYRLRETQVVTENLEKEFADAQQFYRDNPVDEFLELDPWTLPVDQLAYLRHFCDKGFFTVEREILVKLLERQFESASTPAPALPNASARLAQAVANRETRLLNLREAVELYRRGRDAEVTVPIDPTPEQDQAMRAEVVDRLAAVRRQIESLDSRINELQALLKR